MTDGIPEQKKDRRMLVLFLFGLLVFVPDFFSFIITQTTRLRNNCFFCEDVRAGEARSTEQVANPGPRLAFFLNKPMPINQASRRDLALLPGIGDQLAGRIIAFRIRNHGIHNGYELEEVPGIGKKIQKKISPLVTFEQP